VPLHCSSALCESATWPERSPSLRVAAALTSVDVLSILLLVGKQDGDCFGNPHTG
jgi:hypothetical protein